MTNADRISFIGDGRVEEIGSHDELIDKPKGQYKRLVESQGCIASTILLDGMSKLVHAQSIQFNFLFLFHIFHIHMLPEWIH